MSAGIAGLSERLKRAVERNRTIQLSAEDLDWFVVSGAYAAIVNAALGEAFQAAAARLESRGASIPPTEAREQELPQATKTMPDVFSPATLAKWWGVSDGAIYNAIRSGDLRHFRLGDRLLRIPRDAVLAYEEAQKVVT